MKLTLSVFAAGAGLLILGFPAIAHHSFAAEYDSSKKVELRGVVTKFEWTNPHAHFYLDVTDPKGKVANWNLELASPNMMQRNGWTRHSLKEGDHVEVVATPAKDGTNTASAQTIQKSDGTKLTFMAAPPPDVK
ncbi:MAG: hypothetical protein JWO19_5484 [Bryobacterales bacterium]|nr:hypothetical protein [Bryobacterales bacterium]